MMNSLKTMILKDMVYMSGLIRGVIVELGRIIK
jgi:hypothetical protein